MRKLWNTIKSGVSKIYHAVSGWFAKSSESVKSELAEIDSKLAKIHDSHNVILNKIADKQHAIKISQNHPQATFIKTTANRLISLYSERESKIKQELNFWQHKRNQYISNHAAKFPENITSNIPSIRFEL